MSASLGRNNDDGAKLEFSNQSVPGMPGNDTLVAVAPIGAVTASAPIINR